MDKKQNNEGLVRGNIKPSIAHDGINKQGGVTKVPIQTLKPPPPAPKK